MPAIEEVKQDFLARLKQLHDAKTITGAEIVNFLATDCGEGATPEMIAAVQADHDINDECEIDDTPRCSPATDGVWVAAWLWTAYPFCEVCDNSLGRFYTDAEADLVESGATVACGDCQAEVEREAESEEN